MASPMTMEVIRISFSQLVELLRSLDGQRLLKRGVPADARILSVYETHHKDSLDLVLQSSHGTAVGDLPSATSTMVVQAKSD